ncbi:MAG: hypothetical protein JSW11_13030 [Candidatus Heimdallarchaeota archaeon]|nr:MAG: hypothetical protein JSW11_13030 [Candidatus Heimdallarchaeota archaeon]
MCPSILSVLGTFTHSFKTQKNRIRCISIGEFRDTDDIELEMENGSLIIIFYKEFRIKKPMDAKRVLQRLNAFIRQYEYDMLNLGKLDYIFLLPKDYKLTTETLTTLS